MFGGLVVGVYRTTSKTTELIQLWTFVSKPNYSTLFYAGRKLTLKYVKRNYFKQIAIQISLRDFIKDYI